MWGFTKFAPGSPPVRCCGCGQTMTGTLVAAEETYDPDGTKRLEDLRVTHQPCGCVWLAGQRVFAGAG